MLPYLSPDSGACCLGMSVGKIIQGTSSDAGQAR
jgi:hypothetical protein